MRVIQATNLAIAVLIVAAFVVPRFAPRGEGFAAAASATVVFLGMVLLAALVALGLAAWTLRRWRTLPSPGRWLGVVPAAACTAGVAGLIAFLRF